MEEKIEEKTETVEKEKKGKNKGCLIFFGILVAIIAGLVLGWKYLVSASESTRLIAASGQVEVNSKAARPSQTLSSGDSLKTLAGSEATVFFPGGSELRLDENTEITIKSASEGTVSVFQTVGRTWSRVINLLGVVDYDVETSNMIASVRGTAFATEVTTDETNVDVDDSQIQASIGASKTIIETGFRASAKKGQPQVLKSQTPASVRSSSWFAKNRERDIKLLEKIKKRANSPIQLLKTFREVSPEDIAKLKNLALRAQSGAFNISESQANQLENLNFSSPADIATALYIIDPEDFGDRAHWTRVIRALFPLIERFGVERVFQEQ